MQYQVAAEAFPCTYSSFAVALTITGPLLERLQLPSTKTLQISRNLQAVHFDYARISYIEDVKSEDNLLLSSDAQPLLEDGQEPRLVIVGLDHHGIRSIEIGHSHSRGIDASWYEILRPDDESSVRYVTCQFNVGPLSSLARGTHCLLPVGALSRATAH